MVRATHVEVPATDDGDYEDYEPEYDDPGPEFEPDPEPEPEPELRTRSRTSRSSSRRWATAARPVTESDDIDYRMPKLSFLKRSSGAQKLDTKGIERTGAQLVEALSHFNVEARLIGTVSGPHVTRYELRLAPGIKMSKVATLKDDLAYALAAEQVRILAPIPGKQAVGVEVPNRVRTMVHLGDVFQDAPKGWSPLSVWLGKDIAGKAIGTDLAKQPHILIAGTTGSGKSGCVNSMLSSVLLHASPNEVRLVLVDPKRVELNHYEGIPHLLTPVVTSPRLAANVLSNLIKEMEERYGVMSRSKTRNLVELNRVRQRSGEAPLPYILCVIDELADLMMVAPADVEDSIIRLAQKSRAVGIHLVLATQRPSADVITGMIKANVPARIAFAVSSQTDSRVILDQNGAESLLGQGDMLFRPAGESRTARIQGAFIAEEEIERLTDHWRKQGEPELQEELLEAVEPEEGADGPDGDFDPDQDDLLGDAIATVVQMGTASTSMLQRRMRVGYTRAGRLIDMMERRGVISGYEGSKARQVLITEADLPRVLEALSEPAVAAPGAHRTSRRLASSEYAANAEHWRNAARGTDATAARHRRCRGPDEDSREVPAGARERGVRHAARTHVRQDVPAHLRGDARARPARARRGVPGGVRARGRDRAAARTAGGGGPRPAARAAGGPRLGGALGAGGDRGGARGDRAGERRRRGATDNGVRAGDDPVGDDRHGAPPQPARPRRVRLRITPVDAHVRLRRHGAGNAGRVREHDRRPAEVPGQAHPREPRQARRPAQGERQAR